MYDSRVKGIWYQNDHLASISSKGDVTVWTVNIENQEITELCSTNIGCRPICLTILNLADFADEYILKREDTDEETVESTSNHAKKPRLASKQVGRVVIENDDDEDAEDIRPIDESKRKVNNKNKGNKLQKKDELNKSSEKKTPSMPLPKETKKRKSIENSQQTSVTKTKKQKLKNRSNNSTYVEEDME